jgi:hypothetical protein
MLAVMMLLLRMMMMMLTTTSTTMSCFWFGFPLHVEAGDALQHRHFARK